MGIKAVPTFKDVKLPVKSKAGSSQWLCLQDSLNTMIRPLISDHAREGPQNLDQGRWRRSWLEMCQ